MAVNGSSLPSESLIKSSDGRQGEEVGSGVEWQLKEQEYDANSLTSIKPGYAALFPGMYCTSGYVQQHKCLQQRFQLNSVGRGI